MANRDAPAVAALVEQQFHDECSITWPASLSYGGTVSGRARLVRALVAAVSAGAGLEDLELVTLAVGEAEVAAELRFSWRSSSEAAPIKTGAVEWWSFDRDGLVRSVRAYYADTAALIEPNVDDDDDDEDRSSVIPQAPRTPGR